jgi:hypothetical protein
VVDNLGAPLWGQSLPLLPHFIRAFAIDAPGLFGVGVPDFGLEPSRDNSERPVYRGLWEGTTRRDAIDEHLLIVFDRKVAIGHLHLERLLVMHGQDTPLHEAQDDQSEHFGCIADVESGLYCL